MNYWLLKSEPDCFGIQNLAQASGQTTYWDGVRNYQARNYLRDSFKRGDLALFYHSNGDPAGVAGVVQVIREGYPDHTAWDAGNEHYDPKSSPENPIWHMVDVKLVEIFPNFLPLDLLRKDAQLEGLELLRKGSRLSVQPVSAAHFKHIRALGIAKKKSARS